MMLPEGLGTGSVRGPDSAQPMSSGYAMSMDGDAWVLGGFPQLLNKGVCCVPSTDSQRLSH